MTQMDTHQDASSASPQHNPHIPKVSCPCWPLDSHYIPMPPAGDPLLLFLHSTELPITYQATSDNLQPVQTSLLSSGLNYISSEDQTASKFFLLGYSPTALGYHIKFLPYILQLLLPQLIILDIKLSLFNLLCGFHLLTGPRLLYYTREYYSAIKSKEIKYMQQHGGISK